MKTFRSAILLASTILLGLSVDAQTAGKNPVIIIPGVTGTHLVDASGKTVWFSIKRNKADDLRLPVTSPILSRNRDSLRPVDIIRKVDIPVLPDVEVYQPLIDVLIERGYTEAEWNTPKAADVFYVFPYDWRRDNVETARLLMQKMTAAKRKLGRSDLKFDILAHSMGGLVARYAAMYGSADLPRARKPVPTWAGAAHINKILLFGTPNEGAMSSLDALINGYPIIADRKLPLVDDLRPEDVMSSPSAFQLLPHQDYARFLDEDLDPVSVDLFSVDTWIKYGWGAIADPKFLGKLKDVKRLAVSNDQIKPKPADKDSNFDDRILSRTTFAQVKAYYASALSRAKRFHDAMDAVSKPPIEVLAYGGNCEQTLSGAVIFRDEKGDGWRTLLSGKDFKTSTGQTIKSDQVKAAIFEMGDGRVTQRSLLGGSATDTAGNKFTSSFLACGSHTKLFLEKPIKDSFISALVVEKGIQP